MNNLEKFELVNKAETVEDLEKAIIEIAKEDTKFYYKQYEELISSGLGVIIDDNLPELIIQGRTKIFDANKMKSYVKLVVYKNYSPNLLTREFGIRQQALYLTYYLNCK